MKLFISYSRQDNQATQQIAETLQEIGHDVWFDDRLEAGQDWWQEISRNIDRCDAFVYLLSPSSSQSEIIEAEYRQAQERGKMILPVLIAGDENLVRQNALVSALDYLDARNEVSTSALRQRLSDVLSNAGIETSQPSSTDSLSQVYSEGIEEDASDGLAFTHFYPAEVVANTEAALHIYIHLYTVLDLVRQDFEKRKNFESIALSDTEVADTVFKRGTTFKVVPTIRNARVSPISMDIEWQDDFEHGQFTVKPKQDIAAGAGCSGAVRIFVGPACIAQLPVIFRVGEHQEDEDSSETRFPFKKIFISYAHEDQIVVKAVDRLYAKHPELKTIVDYKAFREGDDWWEKAKEGIRNAEALQLFWSQYAAASEPVQREWRYALDLPRPIIPVMLKPEGPIPDPLRNIIFGDFEQFIDNL
jgi:hypothetical protein